MFIVSDDNKDTDSNYIPDVRYGSEEINNDRSSRNGAMNSEYKLSFEENLKNNFDTNVKFGKKRSDKGPKSKILSASFYHQNK